MPKRRELRPRIIKRCECGRTYTREQWDELPLFGYVDKGKITAGELLELRRCECGSSVAIDVGEEPDTVPRIRID